MARLGTKIMKVTDKIRAPMRQIYSKGTKFEGKGLAA